MKLWLGLTLMSAVFINIGCSDEASDAAASSQIGLIKLQRSFSSHHPNTNSYGTSLSASQDGTVVAVGAESDVLKCTDSGNDVNITNDKTKCTIGTLDNGTVYVYHTDGDQTWFLKPEQSHSKSAKFGASVALSSDGRWLAVGAPNDSHTNDVTPTNCSAVISQDYLSSKCDAEAGASGSQGFENGAIYVYKYDASAWTLQYLIRQEHAGTIGMESYHFGQKLMWSEDGTMLVVGVPSDKNSPLSVYTQPTANGSGSTLYGSIYVYKFDKDNDNFPANPFDYYYQSPQTEALGKYMHPTEDGVVVNGDSNVMVVKLKQANNNGVTELTGMPTLPSPVTISEANLYGDQLVIGLPKLTSDCTGVVVLPDPDNHADNCLNGNGTTDAYKGPYTGGVMVLKVANYAVTPQALIKYTSQLEKEQIGQSLLMSPDQQLIIFGKEDEIQCPGVYRHTEECNNYVQNNNIFNTSETGAIGMFAAQDSSWDEVMFVKSPELILSENMGGTGKIFRYGNFYYLILNHANSCPGIQDLSQATACTKQTGLAGVVHQYSF
ncbi:MAG: hypothetical protein ISP86_02370 [Shewanellaceae bacterium]|nr:hypothetical protein [Shewanellaceae bacterium]